MVSWLILIACSLPAELLIAADKPPVVDLWPGRRPDETGDGGAEKVLMSPKLDRKQVEVTEPTTMLTNVTDRRSRSTVRRKARVVAQPF